MEATIIVYMFLNNYLKRLLKYLLNFNIKAKIIYLSGNYVTEQTRLCNKLLSTLRKPTSYLEIGVDQGQTFRKIVSDIKRSVDPYGTYDATYRMTSEMFFALNKMFMHHTYDVIFIDASHFSLIVDSEIKESFKILNKGGYIVLHDTDPMSKEVSEIVLKDMLTYLRNLAYPHNQSHTNSLVWKAFNGDVWKSVAQIRMNKPNIEVFTINNFCCSILKRGKQKDMLKKIPFKQLVWNYFMKNRKQILNSIDFSEIDKFL